MKLWLTLKCSLPVLLAFPSGVGAALIPYAANPSGNSIDFAVGVAAHGGTITTLTFEDLAHGATTIAYPGVSITADEPVLFVTSSPWGGAIACSPPAGHTGEGCYFSEFSKALAKDGVPPWNGYSVTVSFDEPVLAVGMFVIDMANQGGVHTVEVFDGPNGSGASLGTIPLAALSFQLGYRYFIGALSTEANIRSLRYTNPEPDGDSTYIDNVQFARFGATAVPEPTSTWLVGLTIVTAILRRFRRRI